MKIHPIYTEHTNCQDCYKCIRQCPVKAIKVENHSASLMQDKCIFCGHCTIICPSDAKKVREDTQAVKAMLKTNTKVILSLAPSWASEFGGISSEKMVSALLKLGFTAISETALGAEMVSSRIRQYSESLKNKVMISQCCPVVVEYIKKYHPSCEEYLVQLDTPMLAHGKFLKQHYGADTKVVFAGPCIAKKKEAEKNGEAIDHAITFQRLRKWMDEKGILPASETPEEQNSFEPVEAKNGTLYPIDGGMIAGIKKNAPVHDLSFMTFSGTRNIGQILANIEDLKPEKPLFLELLACPGGCINGPGGNNQGSPAKKRLDILCSFQNRSANSEPNLLNAVEENGYDYIEQVKQQVPQNEALDEMLKAIGKFSKQDELNCGGCGYENCRDFATSVLAGKSERTMCVSYMRKVANDKATVLLQRMPFGVVMVDEKMRIVESNENFAQLLGEDGMMAYQAKPGLEGADLQKLVPYAHYFQKLIESGEETLEKDIREENSYYHLSIFSIQKKRLLCGIIQNLKAPELNREEVVKRTKQVIRENLATVQKIAYYLGENASKTENLLKSIVDFHSDDND